MPRPKKVGIDEAVPVRLSAAERDLILERTFADQELTARLEIAEVVRSRLTAHYTLWELEELQGYIAAEANHTPDSKLKRKLDKLYDRIRKVETSYVDDLSPEHLRNIAT